MAASSCLPLWGCGQSSGDAGVVGTEKSRLSGEETPQSGELPAPPALGNYRIHLRLGPLEGTASASRRAQSAAPTQADAGSQATEKREAYFIAFNRPITDAMKTSVASAGAQIVEYAPDHSLLVMMKPSAATAITALSYVLDIIPFLPDYKIDPDLMTALGSAHTSPAANDVFFNIALMEDTPTLQTALAALGVQIVTQAGRQVVAHGPLSAVPELAKLDSVKFIEEHHEAELHNDVASGIVGLETISNLGYQGAGQTVVVGDTGLDSGNAGLISGTLLADFSGRVLGMADYTHPKSDNEYCTDVVGHGTHVAGSVLGDGQLSGGKLKGMAPKATLYMQRVMNATGSIPKDFVLSAALQDAYGIATARIHTNSWGFRVYGKYTANSVDLDNFMWSHPDFAVLFSAGNLGRSGGPSVGAPGTAKNCITVGATVNYRPNLMASSNPSDRAEFSSYGTVDNRVKPDVVAPGEQIASTLSTKSDPMDAPPSYPGNSHYGFMNGTSMSTPITAGSLALLREYVQEQLGRPNPSAAVLKAMLIDGALVDGVPTEKGWGKIAVDHSILSAKIVDDSSSLSTGGKNTYRSSCTVGNPALPLKVVLVWTDFPGSVNYTKALTNDLDLVVTSPSGRRFLGNAGAECQGDCPADHLNNVETVVLNAPEVGSYTFEVSGYEVSQGGQQPYALVCSSDFLGAPKNLRASSTESSNSVVWDQVPGATGYEIEADGRTVSTTSNTYVDNGLAGNSTHKYRVRAEMSGSKVGAWSNTLVQLTALPSPQVSVTIMDGYANLSWPLVPQASSYDVYMDGANLASVASSTFRYELDSPMATHSFVVRARSDFGFGSSSPVTLTQPATGIYYEREMSSARVGAAVAQAGDGTAYVFGGRDTNSIVLDSVEIPERGVFKRAMPHAVSRAAAVAVGNRIYVVGGNDGTQDLAFLQEYDIAADTWRDRQAMPQRRSGHAAFALNDKLIVIGGVDGANSLRSTEVYDPLTNTWSEMRAMPTPRNDFASVMTNGKIYCLGGRYGSAELDVVEAYDTATDRWTTQKSMPSPNAEFTVTEVNGRFISIGGTRGRTISEYDPVGGNWTERQPWPTTLSGHAAYGKGGAVHTVGGLSSTAPTKNVMRYDLATSPWQGRASMTLPRYFWPVMGELNGKLYLCGGVTGTGDLSVSKACEAYDPVQDRWTDLAPLDVPIHNSASVGLANRLYSIGGSSDYLGANPMTDIREYDPDTNQWTTRMNLPVPIEWAQAAGMGTAIYVTGGGKISSDGTVWEPQSSAYRFDTTTNQWTQIANLNHARRSHVSVALRGKVYVLGGDTPPTVEEYDPAMDTWTTRGSLDLGTVQFGTVLNNHLYVKSTDNELFEVEPATAKARKLGLKTYGTSAMLATLAGRLYSVGGVSVGNGYAYLHARNVVYSTTEVLPLLEVGTAKLDPMGGKGLLPLRAARVPLDGWSKLEVAVHFDPAKLAITNVTPGPALPDASPSFAVDGTNGVLRITWTGDAGSGRLVTADGTIANIEVDVVDTATGLGSTPLTIDPQTTALFDSSGLQDELFRTADGGVDLFTRGDVNGDGKVTIIDALALAQFTTGLTVNPFLAAAADVNCDGQIAITDALLVSKYSGGLVPPFSCQ